MGRCVADGGLEREEEEEEVKENGVLMVISVNKCFWESAGHFARLLT
jgi:hypothetical protein